LEGLDARIVWMPFELRPFPQATLRPEDDYLQTAWKRGVHPTAAHYGVTVRLPTVSPQPHTRKAFIGMQYARQNGLGSEYTEAVLRAFFQEDRDIGEADVLCEIAESVGLPPEDFTAALHSPKYASLHDHALATAARFNVRAVPSILIGERMFSGMESAEAIRRAVADASNDLIQGT